MLQDQQQELVNKYTVVQTYYMHKQKQDILTALEKKDVKKNYWDDQGLEREKWKVIYTK